MFLCKPEHIVHCAIRKKRCQQENIVLWNSFCRQFFRVCVLVREYLAHVVTSQRIWIQPTFERFFGTEKLIARLLLLRVRVNSVCSALHSILEPIQHQVFHQVFGGPFDVAQFCFFEYFLDSVKFCTFRIFSVFQLLHWLQLKLKSTRMNKLAWSDMNSICMRNFCYELKCTDDVISWIV